MLLNINLAKQMRIHKFVLDTNVCVSFILSKSEQKLLDVLADGRTQLGVFSRLRPCVYISLIYETNVNPNALLRAFAMR